MKVHQAAEKDFDPTPYLAHVRSLQNKDGGFGLWPKDVSTAEGTLAALTILQKAQARAPDRAACLKYLNAHLAATAEAAAKCSDLAIQRDLHRCLISLSILGAEVPKLQQYLKILEQDGQAWGIYYRLSAAKAFGRPLTDQAWIKKLDALATESYLGTSWTHGDRHYALEAMDLLGGKFTYARRIRAGTRGLHRPPWDGAQPSALISAWRKIRMARLLGAKTPWLEAWLKKSASIKPEPVGGYAVIPGILGEPRASYLAFRLLQARGAAKPAPDLARRWQDKQQKGGYYESAPQKLSRWFTESDRLGRRISETWAAISAIQIAGKAPADRKALVGWLIDLLAKHRDDLPCQQVLRILECFEMLGQRPQNGEELVEYFRKEFGSDLKATIRAMGIMGVKPDLDNAGDRLSAIPDRVRVFGIPIEVSVLAETFEALDAIGEDYAGAEYFLDRLGRMQNPDGGLHKPESAHSNIYDTIAALRMAKLLPALEARYKSRRKSGLLIRAAKAAQRVEIDGKLSEWDTAAGVRFQEQSRRADKDRNHAVVCAMWDDAFLYLAFSVKDSNLQARVKAGEANVYLDDGIEFLLDPNCDRTRTYMPDDVCVHVNLLGAVMDDRGTQAGPYDTSWNSRVRSAFVLKGTLNDASDEDTGYTAEVALPWSELGWQPGRSGSRIGINLCVNDRDDKKDGYRHGDWAETNKFHVPRYWGEIQFADSAP